MWFCPQCGSKNEDSYSFCTECGTKKPVIPETPAAAPADPAAPVVEAVVREKTKPAGGSHTILYVLAALVVALIVAIVVLVSGKNKQEKAPAAAPESAPEQIVETPAPTESEEPEAEAAETEAEAVPEKYVYPVRTPVAFSEMEEDLFDSDAFFGACEDMTAKCAEENAFAAIAADWDVIVDQYDRFSNDFSIVQLQYYSDPSNEEVFNRMSDLDLLSTDAWDKMCGAVNAVLASPYAERMTAYIGSEPVLDDIINHVPLNDEMVALQKENTDLTDEYFALCDEMPEDVGEQMGELYLRLIDNLIAQAEFYEEYPDYPSYIYKTTYMRDYKPEDCQVLYDWAKEFAVPYFIDTIIALGDGYEDEMDRFDALQLSEGEIIERTEPYLSSVSPETAEIFSRMVELGLYDLAASPTKAESGFTTELVYYGVPFIFNCPYGYGSDIETLIHEFGHYYEACMNDEPQVYQYDCIDIAEIDSQGMEMLMLKNADAIFGEGLGDFVRLYNVYSMLSSVIDGCIFDDFQQRAFAARKAGELNTAQEVTDLYLQVEADYYGYYSAFLGWGENWWQVHHTFDSPFYYVSYATSATAALGILTMSEEDYDAALAMYNELVAMGSGQGFENTLKVCGLPNPLTEEGTAQLTEGLTVYLDPILLAGDQAA